MAINVLTELWKWVDSGIDLEEVIDTARMIQDELDQQASAEEEPDHNIHYSDGKDFDDGPDYMFVPQDPE